LSGGAISRLITVNRTAENISLGGYVTTADLTAVRTSDITYRILLTYGLFNYAVSSSDRTVSNYWMIEEHLIGKDMERSGRDQI
jgi:hypothetical protein